MKQNVKKSQPLLAERVSREASQKLVLSKRQLAVAMQERIIKQELDKFKASVAEVKTDALPREVRRMLQSIHQELFEPTLRVFELKRKCGVRNNNISTDFRRALGMGIREYIEDRRIQAAMRLLAYEELEIFAIGFTVGYSHEESFTRAFRRRLGRTPSQYRREIVKKECQTK
jgi:AraC-like DNA-binding protein